MMVFLRLLTGVPGNYMSAESSTWKSHSHTNWSKTTWEVVWRPQFSSNQLVCLWPHLKSVSLTGWLKSHSLLVAPSHCLPFRQPVQKTPQVRCLLNALNVHRWRNASRSDVTPQISEEVWTVQFIVSFWPDAVLPRWMKTTQTTVNQHTQSVSQQACL